MKSIVFKSIMLLVFTAFFTNVNAQEQNNVTYKIVDKGSVKDIQPYIDALNTANFKYHRLRNQRHTIVFDTGVKVELFSANELIAAGRKINATDYPEIFSANRQEPLFKLGPNNFILEEHSSTGKHH
jgi:hypothetical protein